MTEADVLATVDCFRRHGRLGRVDFRAVRGCAVSWGMDTGGADVEHAVHTASLLPTIRRYQEIKNYFQMRPAWFGDVFPILGIYVPY